MAAHTTTKSASTRISSKSVNALRDRYARKGEECAYLQEDDLLPIVAFSAHLAGVSGNCPLLSPFSRTPHPAADFGVAVRSTRPNFDLARGAMTALRDIVVIVAPGIF